MGVYGMCRVSAYVYACRVECMFSVCVVLVCVCMCVSVDGMYKVCLLYVE